MQKTIKAQLKNGLDSLVRVTNILRKKEFNIKDISMTSTSNRCCSDLIITIYENEGLGVKQVINQMEKIIDIYEIREVN
ncbi:ACT domain-containing protein [Abyssisolibacter fermentans]|uniref:ACT domain-containing protein n=1 Tax=Abyssisolibacter fermentans TaxID=1766203 RepID=UPI00082CD0C1|nr:ACT domain-containing protein [Abyssisolibacter fermentans]